MMRGEDQMSRLICELCSLLLTVLRTPTLSIPSPATSPPPSPQRQGSAAAAAAAAAAAGRRRPEQLSPSRFASMLLGASLTLMLSGSVAFVIGFILMPWVLGIALFFYFLGFLSSLSGLGRAVLCGGALSAGTSPKEVSRPTFFQTTDYLEMKWQLKNE